MDDASIAVAIRTLDAPLPFTIDDAPRAAALFNATGRRRTSLPDCMIAAVAIRAGAALATNNRDDFARFSAHGLRLAPDPTPT